jgi:hypothetical protein
VASLKADKTKAVSSANNHIKKIRSLKDELMVKEL